jgi:hypothetical protein
VENYFLALLNLLSAGQTKCISVRISVESSNHEEGNECSLAKHLQYSLAVPPVKQKLRTPGVLSLYLKLQESNAPGISAQYLSIITKPVNGDSAGFSSLFYHKKLSTLTI